MTEIRPYAVHVSDESIDDLHRRLAQARWPEPATVPDWSQGVPLDWLRALCGYWADGYDWRRLEAQLNALPQFRTGIDGTDIHFIHLRSPHPDALPLLLTHGWPGSVVEFLDVLGPLAEAGFHVVCPSLPGFGFSGRPQRTGWNPRRIAAAWAELMGRLGYERYGAQGGDWGAFVTMNLATLVPERLAGIHLNYAPLGPAEGDELTDEERDSEDAARLHRAEGRGYAVEQGTRPQTVGYGLVDSPVGQCAWIAEKYWAWTDHDGDPLSALTRDQMLDNISIYWHTGTAASSARIYWENSRRERVLDVLDVPVGMSVFPREIIRPSRRWCERQFTDLRFYERPPRGGHFAAFEQPASFVDQVVRTFRTMQ
jgi:pimeloyl-ACP methyl ester carboxylesterase